MIMQEIANLTTKQLEQLLAERKAKEQAEIQERRKAYESIKSGFINDMESRARNVVDRVKAFHEQVVKETRAFYELMKEYGILELGRTGVVSLKRGDECLDGTNSRSLKKPRVRKRKTEE